MKYLIRTDDVLQSTNFSLSQGEALKVRSFFEWFKRNMKYFEGKPVVLATLAEGIDKEPEWVEYIKRHPEWEVQCHGWTHVIYRRLPDDIIKEHLIKAKKKLEETFNCKVTRFYPPKMIYNDNTQRIARECGMEEAREEMCIDHLLRGKTFEGRTEVYFHFWGDRQSELIKEYDQHISEIS